ncbi:hypothetical protein RE628_05880 [Paenibacillus sp. D2_2]|uniref:hypothetical protein n=1 Tax=Paenibacillus sp. D2_2 TaxID=3073092 RepID=UPI0028166A71|nr:hypothetical protein [Paenibacillus sp. D2_2]WMT41967.1 hypothetical protein RE628_05880 [Paenibacillus sp. D2_2]
MLTLYFDHRGRAYEEYYRRTILRLHPEERIVPTDPEYRPLNRKVTKLIEEAKESVFFRSEIATFWGGEDG